MGEGRRAPKFGIAAVYSDEPVRGQGGRGAALACAGYGSVMTVTAALGLALAAAALDRLAAPRVVERNPD